MFNIFKRHQENEVLKDESFDYDFPEQICEDEVIGENLTAQNEPPHVRRLYGMSSQVKAARHEYDRQNYGR